MAQTESSALIRFINNAVQEPIYDTQSAFEEPSAFESAPEIMTDSFSRPARGGALKWAASGVLLLGGGIGLAVLLMKFAGPGGEAASTAAPAPVAAPAVAAAPASAPAPKPIAGFLPATGADSQASAPAAAAPVPADEATAADPNAAAIPAPDPAADPSGDAPADPTAAPALAAGEPEATPIPVASIEGQFLSEPPGAKVTLVEAGTVRETLTAPAVMKVEVGRTYQVLFEKKGYQTAARAVSPKSGETVRVVVMLERAVGDDTAAASAAAAAPAVKSMARRKASKSTRSRRAAKRSKAKRRTASRATKAVATSGAKGTLMVGARPPCDIYINGKRTGLTTPQRAIKLNPGSYRITLVNREHRIKSTSRVVVKPGGKVRLIRNLTKQMKR